MTTPENVGIVRPVRTRRTPRLGPWAIIAATEADFQYLHKKLSLPHTRKLFLSKLEYGATASRLPSLVGPLMGAPYAVMVLETLYTWGVRNMLFVGWCGAISNYLRTGDILLPHGAIIDEGTSLHYQGATGAVVEPCSTLYDSVRRMLEERAVAYRKGMVWSTDGIFRETPVQIRKFREVGAVAVEMEVSALFSAARMYDVSVASILIVSDELSDLKWQPGFKSKIFLQSRTMVCDLLADIHRSLVND